MYVSINNTLYVASLPGIFHLTIGQLAIRIREHVTNYETHARGGFHEEGDILLNLKVVARMNPNGSGKRATRTGLRSMVAELIRGQVGASPATVVTRLKNGHKCMHHLCEPVVPSTRSYIGKFGTAFFDKGSCTSKRVFLKSVSLKGQVWVWMRLKSPSEPPHTIQSFRGHPDRIGDNPRHLNSIIAPALIRLNPPSPRKDGKVGQRPGFAAGV
jgi:hypothetical protein